MNKLRENFIFVAYMTIMLSLTYYFWPTTFRSSNEDPKYRAAMNEMRQTNKEYDDLMNEQAGLKMGREQPRTETEEAIERVANARERNTQIRAENDRLRAELRSKNGKVAQ